MENEAKKNFWTRQRIRQIGRALEGTFAVATLPAMIDGNKGLSITCWAITAVGRFLTLLYPDNEQ
jgi:hypothetical protein